jgi:beta-lactamase superfamily II metal-dependent hydrolase
LADNPDFKFVFFNVGHGDATLISNSNTCESILVDAKRSDCIIRELEDNKFLLRAILVTHWDADHVDGIPGLLNFLRDRKEQIQFFSHKQSKKNESYRKFRFFLDEAKEDNTFHVIEHNDFIFTSKTPPNNHYQLIGMDIIILWPENSPPIPEGKEIKSRYI